MFKQYIKTSDILSLPHSNGNYSVSSKGAVFNRQNEKLLTEFNCLGSPFVKIDWINGYKEYEIKDLVAFTFKPWRSIKDPILELTNFTKLKAVEVRNWATKEVVVYTSCKECADAVKVKTTTLNWRLKSDGQKVYADGLQFRYYGDPTPWLD